MHLNLSAQHAQHMCSKSKASDKTYNIHSGDTFVRKTPSQIYNSIMFKKKTRKRCESSKLKT